MRFSVFGLGCCLGSLLVASCNLAFAADTVLTSASNSTLLAANTSKNLSSSSLSLDDAIKNKSAKEKTAIKNLNNALNLTKAFTAKFQQEVYSDKGESLARSNGNLALQRPMQFVMTTLVPDKVVLYLKDGDIYYYDELVSQVTIYSMNRLNDNPFLLLVDKNNDVWNNFSVSQDDNRYSLVPLQTQDIRSLTLSFTDKDKNNNGATLLESITIRLNDGSTNFYRFTDHNLQVDPSVFNVKLPIDVEINDERN